MQKGLFVSLTLLASVSFAGEADVRAVGDLVCTVDAVVTKPSGETVVDFTLRPEDESCIRCRLALPVREKWTGELWGKGNSSYGGGLPGLDPLLREGHAAVTTDLGTHRYVHGDRKGQTWPEAVFTDFAWRATHLMTVYGRKLVKAWYGVPAKRAYFRGGSTGGRQGLCEAMRFPGDYDGILVTIPAAMPVAMCAQTLNLYRQTHDETGRGLFTTNQLRLLADAPIEYMKGRDAAPYAGAILSNPFLTEPEIDGILALVAKKDPSLADADLQRRMKGIFLGAKDSRGRVLCHGMLPGAFHGNARGASVETKALLPAAVLHGGDTYSAYPDWEEFERKIVPRGGELNASATNMTDFAGRRGKLIVTCGWEDQTTPAPEIISWYEALAEANGGFDKVKGFCRLFPLPGTAHGGGKGRITIGERAVTPQHEEMLRRWVEDGTAPETFPLEWPAKKLTIPVPAYPELCRQDAKGVWRKYPFPRERLRRPDARLFETKMLGDCGFAPPEKEALVPAGAMAVSSRLKASP